MGNHRAVAKSIQRYEAPGPKRLTGFEFWFTLYLHYYDLHPDPRQLRRPRRHQPGEHPPPAGDLPVSTITPGVLGCALSTITTLTTRSGSRSITLGIGDMRRGDSPDPRSVISRSEHVSSRFFSIANSSWRGAARRPNASGVDVRPVDRRGAGQQVVRADHRFLASHASVLRLVSSAAQLPMR